MRDTYVREREREREREIEIEREREREREKERDLSVYHKIYGYADMFPKFHLASRSGLPMGEREGEGMVFGMGSLFHYVENLT